MTGKVVANLRRSVNGKVAVVGEAADRRIEQMLPSRGMDVRG